jgi:ribosomal protein S18 acetylase RimI-like enzyme
VLVAVDGEGRVLGGATYVPGPGPYAESEREDEAGIRMLAVAPWAQGRGIGRALTEACMALARSAGRRRIVLLTLDSMTPAHRLYEGLGFRRAPGRDWTPEPRLRLLGYEHDLD